MKKVRGKKKGSGRFSARGVVLCVSNVKHCGWLDLEGVGFYWCAAVRGFVVCIVAHLPTAVFCTLCG